MSNKLQQAIENLIPFIIVGVAIALFFGLIMMFFYVAVWGFIIGGVLWLASIIKHYFFPSVPPPKKGGRIIDHNERK